MNTSRLQNIDVSYLDDVFFKDGVFVVHSHKDLKQIPQMHLSLFCHKHAIYGIPSTELIELLGNEIGDKSQALEIGAGCGIFDCLGIRQTDSYMQELPEIKLHYGMMGQPTIKYGADIEKIGANEAIIKYSPTVVFGSWITHKYDEKRHEIGGNAYGVVEEDILSNVSTYMVYGNHKTHGVKPILKEPHRIIKEDFMYSRSMSKEENSLYIWK